MADASAASPDGASLRATGDKARPVLAFAGRLDTATAGPLWNRALREAGRAHGRRLTLDLGGLQALDTAGAALLLAVQRAHGDAVVEGASEAVASVLERARAALAAPRGAAAAPRPSLREVLRAALAASTGGIAYVGEAVVAVLRLPARHRMFRMADFLRTADQAGVRAVPLVALLGTLMGFILSFQSLVPMRRYGADAYVASLVAVSLLRELGPLLAAVVLAGRSGSAFAAELGTMKVNQEIDALTTMGLDPMTMQVLPRLAAAMLVMPMLTVLMELSGLLGMSVVLVGSGIPFSTITSQVVQWLQPKDFYQGLFKAAVFGAAVAAIGCRAGLSTGVGPRAVGLAATSAVVGGIVSTILLDGLFAVLFFRLGI